MIPARFESMCSGCGEAIEEGDPIGRVDEDWCCATCVRSFGGDDFERANGQGSRYPMSSTYEPGI